MGPRPPLKFDERKFKKRWPHSLTVCMQEAPTFLVLQLVQATNKQHVHSGSVQLVIFFSLCHATPARLRFRSPIGTRMRCNEQEWFFRNCLLERLILHLHVCEIPLHTLLIHCRDVHTFVEAQVFISRNFCLPNAGCAFQTRRVPNCQ